MEKLASPSDSISPIFAFDALKTLILLFPCDSPTAGPHPARQSVELEGQLFEFDASA